jgi:hypothetical protein
LFIKTNPTLELTLEWALCILCELLHLCAQVPILLVEQLLTMFCRFCITLLGVQRLFRKRKVITLFKQTSVMIVGGRCGGSRIFVYMLEVFERRDRMAEGNSQSSCIAPDLVGC